MQNRLETIETSCRVRVVESFEELIATRFEGDVNALCWRRQLAGDFKEIVNCLEADAGITTVTDEALRALNLTAAGATARAVLLADQALLRAHDLAPTLDCIVGYPRDDGAGPVITDVHSFHIDSAPVPADTFLCTYLGAPSEGLPNEMAIRRVDIAETRAILLQAHDGADDAEFAAYLTAHCFDLHYAQLADARPYCFGLGNLWRLAIAYPGNPVLPCIHRAPLTPPGAPARLLLIS